LHVAVEEFLAVHPDAFDFLAVDGDFAFIIYRDAWEFLEQVFYYGVFSQFEGSRVEFDGITPDHHLGRHARHLDSRQFLGFLGQVDVFHQDSLVGHFDGGKRGFVPQEAHFHQVSAGFDLGQREGTPCVGQDSLNQG